MNKIWVLVILSAIMASCSTDAGNFTIGEDLTKTESSVVMSDTFKVQLSTVVLDSVVTSTPSTALIGKYTNSVNGSTEFRHFVNFDLNTELGGIQASEFEKYNFDSITFKLSLNGFYKGDTITPVTFNIYRLIEQLKFPGTGSTTTKLYNINSFPSETEPLASVTFIPEPSIDSIEVRLPDSFGLELIDKVKQIKIDNPNSLNSDKDFLEYLKGFVIVPDASANVVLGFKGSTSGIRLKLYTNIVKLELVEKEFDFNISTLGNNFNQSISDRTGTSFESLNSQKEELSSLQTNGISCIQGTAGLLTKLNFPSLNDIYGYGSSVLIRAELVLVPSPDNNYKNLPSTLNFFQSNRQNAWGQTITTTSSSGAPVSVSATLISNPFSGEYYYTANITNFLLDELQGNYYDTRNGLIVGFPASDMSSKADYLFLSSKPVNQLKTKLNLYFLRYE